MATSSALKLAALSASPSTAPIDIPGISLPVAVKTSDNKRATKGLIAINGLDYGSVIEIPGADGAASTYLRLEHTTASRYEDESGEMTARYRYGGMTYRLKSALVCDATGHPLDAAGRQIDFAQADAETRVVVRSVKTLRPELALSRVAQEVHTETTCSRLLGRYADAYQHNGKVVIVGDMFESVELMDLYSGSALSLDDLNFSQKLAVFYQVLQQLKVLHGSGVIHRDIKLENILIATTRSADGSMQFKLHNGLPIVRLIDFGLAQLPSGMCLEGVSADKGVVGTASYMLPEFFGRQNIQSDLYALGLSMVTVFEKELKAQRIGAGLRGNPIEFRGIVFDSNIAYFSATTSSIGLGDLGGKLTTQLAILLQHVCSTLAESRAQVKGSGVLLAAVITLFSEHARICEAVQTARQQAAAAKATAEPAAPAALSPAPLKDGATVSPDTVTSNAVTTDYPSTPKAVAAVAPSDAKVPTPERVGKKQPGPLGKRTPDKGPHNQHGLFKSTATGTGAGAGAGAASTADAENTDPEVSPARRKRAYGASR